MADRGAYRAVKVVLLDGPDFQQLSERANHLFVFLKLSFGPSGIEVRYPDELAHVMAARTRIPVEAVRDALDELEARGWVRREGNVVWVVGQLDNDPHMKPDDDKHRKGVWRHVAGLPRLPIVGQFVAEHMRWFEATTALTNKGAEKELPAAPADVLNLTTLRRAYEGPSKGLARASEAPTSDERIPKTDNRIQQPPRVAVVENSSGGSAANSRFDLLEHAKRECGMGTWGPADIRTASSVIVGWAREHKSADEIFEAIHGARLLVDRNKIEWKDPTGRRTMLPGKPFGLQALKNTTALYDQRDGKAPRPFFDVAIEEYRSADSTGPPSRTANTGPERVQVDIRLARGSNT